MSDKVFFGNEDYYRWLKRGVADGDEQVMNKLLQDVQRYAKPMVLSWISAQDAEDVLMEIACQVLTHIAVFLRKSDNFTPYQRQAWLKELIRSAIFTYLDRSGFGPSYRTRKKWEELGQKAEVIRQDSLEAWQEKGGDLADEGDLLEESAVMNDIIIKTCSLQVGAAEMLTFFYHNLVFFLEGDSEKKGRPDETARRLSEKRLHDLRADLPTELKSVSGYFVAEKLFAGLDAKLIGCEGERYQFDGAKVSAVSSYIKTRIGELKKKEKKRPTNG